MMDVVLNMTDQVQAVYILKQNFQLLQHLQSCVPPDKTLSVVWNTTYLKVLSMAVEQICKSQGTVDGVTQAESET